MSSTRPRREGMHLKNQIWETGHGQLDVPHALAADAGQRHFDAATVADHAAVLDPLVLAAGAFPVLDRAEDALAKQAALFRLEGAVIDRFRVLDFALGPGPDGFGRGDGDGDVFDLVDFVQAEQLAGSFFSVHHAYAVGKRAKCWRYFRRSRLRPGRRRLVPPGWSSRL